MTRRSYGNDGIPVAPSDVPDHSHVDVHVDGRLELCRAIEAFADKHTLPGSLGDAATCI
jgi:hypothetical protein